MAVAEGMFTITMAPAAPELAGVATRHEFTKSFSGGLHGVGEGLLLSVGDPALGEAGYVALETVTGELEGRAGAFALGQLGTMHDGAQQLTYLIVPGSGRDGLAGITGALQLRIDAHGTHHYALVYELAAAAADAH